MEGLGNSMPLVEGSVEKSGLSDVCINCGSPLTGIYCAHCGQKNISRRQTLRKYFENYLFANLAIRLMIL